MDKYFGQFPGAKYLNKEEIKNTIDVLKSKSPYRFSGINLKKYCNKLEKIMARLVNKRYCLAVNSGTSALHCALHAVGIKDNDEIIIPSYGWNADLMSILMMNAVPVIAPVGLDANLELKKLKLLTTKKTKALIIIHMRGYPCNFTEILNFCKRKNILIIEDCSQSFGGTINKKKIGHLGDISMMSFQYNKIVTAGEGGALMTNSKYFFEKAIRFHNGGIDRKIGKNAKKTNDPVGSKVIMSKGLNYRMSELTAAVALAQIKKLKTIIQGCKRNWTEVKKILQKYEKLGYISFKPIMKNCTINYAFLGFYKNKSLSNKKLSKLLKKSKIKYENSDLKDAHHFKTWKSFLIREEIKFKDYTDTENNQNLKKNFFCEISSN
jgi:8-amino-3,8-dideoxy-alpha-D-manno-octulosonate transaminase